MDRYDDDQPVSPTGTEDQDVTSSAATSTAATDETPESSPEAPVEAEETLGDAIAKAVNGDTPESDKAAAENGDDPDETTDPKAKEAGQDPKTQAEKDGKAQEGAQEEDDEGADLEEGQRVPYERFKKVIDQRNEFREQVTAIERERDEYRTGHEQFGAIQGFMRDNDLRPQDVSEALSIAAMFNQDPAGALEAMKAKMQTLQSFVGERLPEDLQARVDSGEIDERDAQALVRSRNENALLRQRAQEADQRQQQQAQAQATQQIQQAMAESANGVQKQLADKDPDFAQKLPWIEKELKLLIAAQRPSTPEQAAALVRQAHETVTRDLGRLVPRREVRPGPSSRSAGGTASASREPASMLEAMSQATGIPLE